MKIVHHIRSIPHAARALGAGLTRNRAKILHGAVLVVFGAAFSLVWLLLKLPLLPGAGRSLPGFTMLCLSLRPIEIALPLLAAAYCLWISFRKSDNIPSWAGFFAVAMGALLLVALPALISAYLPLYDSVNHLARR